MKKRKSSGGGANWMDTYGDMVTLLLCFFVLLYSMSTIDQQKWQQLVASFNPDAVIDPNAEFQGNGGPNADELKGEADTLQQQQTKIDQDMEGLYQKLKQYVEDSGAESTILVTKGDGRVFVSFNEAVFFGGDSSVLQEESKPVLDKVAEVLALAKDSIDELQIMGHTAREVVGKPNNITADRLLASNRATVVLIYLQEKNILPPERMVSVGLGEWRPITDNSTDALRAQNRRVEMLVTGRNLLDEMGDSVETYYEERGTGEKQPTTTPAPSAPVTTATTPTGTPE